MERLPSLLPVAALAAGCTRQGQQSARENASAARLPAADAPAMNGNWITVLVTLCIRCVGFALLVVAASLAGTLSLSAQEVLPPAPNNPTAILINNVRV